MVKTDLRLNRVFKNNCRLPISLHANGAPTDVPGDDMTVMYELVRPTMRGVVVSEGGPHPDAKRGAPPPDTMCEVGSSVRVLPGESALFSVPRTHFSKDWEMHIPFQFKLPPGKGPRDENAWGGEPEIFLIYTFWDLPSAVQRALSAKGKHSLSSSGSGTDQLPRSSGLPKVPDRSVRFRSNKPHL